MFSKKKKALLVQGKEMPRSLATVVLILSDRVLINYEYSGNRSPVVYGVDGASLCRYMKIF